MKWWSLIVVVLLAAACSAPERPEWSVQRVTPPDEPEVATGTCGEIRQFALGSHADQTSLDGTLEELARIAALTGATAALPLLGDVGELDDDTTLDPLERTARQHDLLVLASRSIDDAGATACGVPTFSALYAASGFSDCHFEMEIPIAAYTDRGTPGTCLAEGRPTFLPCWSDDGDHLAVDCVSKEIVRAVGDRWEPAGSPRTITIPRPVETLDPGPEVLTAVTSPACSALTDLFVSGPLPNGTIPDFERLTEAAAGLSPAIRDQIMEFVDASISPPSFEEFEALVASLDELTADACGFPLVSAWASITSTVDTLPCWMESGVAYPAYTIAECPPQEESDEA